jgi:Protein of unknown function (DUF998)
MLAAVGAADRWVMSLTFVVVGACVFVTGLALRPASAPGQLVLMAGAVAGMLVAANPEHPGTSFPVPHMICAAAGCAGVVAWPAGAWRRGPSVPWGLRPAVSARCRHRAAGPGGLVRRRADHQRRAGRPRGTYFRRRAGAVAARRGRILPPCRQGRRHARAEPARRAPGQRRAQPGSAYAQLAFRLVPSGIVTAGTAKPNSMTIHHCASPRCRSRRRPRAGQSAAWEGTTLHLAHGPRG